MIQAPQVRVIGADGEQLGIMDTQEAIRVALSQDLDLVEVAPNSEPPVCRIMNFGKFKYEQQKKEQAARKKSQSVDMKDLRLGRSIKVEKHDLQIKLKKAQELICRGHRLSIFIQIRGRELAHAELGVLLMQNFAEALSDLAKLESPPRKDGKRIHMVMAPLPNLEKILAKRAKAEEAARLSGKQDADIQEKTVKEVDMSVMPDLPDVDDDDADDIDDSDDV